VDNQHVAVDNFYIMWITTMVRSDSSGENYRVSWITFPLDYANDEELWILCIVIPKVCLGMYISRKPLNVVINVSPLPTVNTFFFKEKGREDWGKTKERWRTGCYSSNEREEKLPGGDQGDYHEHIF
jgi:hypothetical protein